MRTRVGMGLLVLAACGGGSGGAAAPAPVASAAPPARVVPVTPKVAIGLASPWESPPSSTRNLFTFTRPGTTVNLVVEPRADHGGAVKRLGEIRTERPDPVTWSSVCGWPAFERRATRTIDSPSVAPPPKEPVRVVTVVVAADEALFTFEATAPDAATADAVAALARAMQCPAAPPGQTDRELAQLR